jgi:hypothetical protein
MVAPARLSVHASTPVQDPPESQPLVKKLRVEQAEPQVRFGHLLCRLEAFSNDSYCASPRSVTLRTTATTSGRSSIPVKYAMLFVDCRFIRTKDLSRSHKCREQIRTAARDPGRASQVCSMTVTQQSSHALTLVNVCHRWMFADSWPAAENTISRGRGHDAAA